METSSRGLKSTSRRCDLLNDKAYVRKINKICDRVEKTLREYVKTRSPESLHDFRTSARRLQAAYSILPKNLRRSKKLRTYAKNRHKLFKASAETRDLDIMISRVAKYKPQTLLLVSKLDRSRTKKAQQLAKEAKATRGLPCPGVDPDQIDADKMSERIKKTSGKLNSKLEEQGSLATSVSAKTKEIHAFRKLSKRLRYVLEFTDTDVSLKQIARLRDYQDLLGEMRDAQITHSFLTKSNVNGRLSSIVDAEKRSVDAAYLAFIQSWKKIHPETQPEEPSITVNAI
jgi:CHAD domain-containing protein